VSRDGRVNVALIGRKFMGTAHTHAYTDVTIFFEPKLRPVKRILCARGDGLPEVAERWGWQEYEADWHKAVTHPEVDLVDICAPSLIHKEVVLAAAEAGKHILCEKPLAMTLEDAREMVAAVERAGIVHSIGFNYRKVPAVALAKQLIDRGAIGQIHHFRGIYSQDWLVDPSFPLVWRLRKKDAGAGASWDLGAHVVDLARYLVGEMSEVVGHQATFIKRRPMASFEDGLKAVAGSEMGAVDVDDTTSFLARFENGAMGTFEVTRYATGHRNQNRVEVYGSQGGVIFDMEHMNELQFYSRSDPAYAQGYRAIQVGEGVHPYMAGWWPAGHIIGFGDTFVHEVLDMLNAIAEDRQANPSFRDGLQCQMILTAVDHSIAERRWVSVAGV
jgi:predicted dehydrogenase